MEEFLKRKQSIDFRSSVSSGSFLDARLLESLDFSFRVQSKLNGGNTSEFVLEDLPSAYAGGSGDRSPQLSPVKDVEEDVATTTDDGFETEPASAPASRTVKWASERPLRDSVVLPPESAADLVFIQAEQAELVACTEKLRAQKGRIESEIKSCRLFIDCATRKSPDPGVGVETMATAAAGTPLCARLSYFFFLLEGVREAKVKAKFKGIRARTPRAEYVRSRGPAGASLLDRAGERVEQIQGDLEVLRAVRGAACASTRSIMGFDDEQGHVRAGSAGALHREVHVHGLGSHTNHSSPPAPSHPATSPFRQVEPARASPPEVQSGTGVLGDSAGTASREPQLTPPATDICDIHTLEAFRARSAAIVEQYPTAQMMVTARGGQADAMREAAIPAGGRAEKWSWRDEDWSGEVDSKNIAPIAHRGGEGERGGGGGEGGGGGGGEGGGGGGDCSEHEHREYRQALYAHCAEVLDNFLLELQARMQQSLQLCAESLEKKTSSLATLQDYPDFSLSVASNLQRSADIHDQLESFQRHQQALRDRSTKQHASVLQRAGVVVLQRRMQFLHRIKEKMREVHHANELKEREGRMRVLVQSAKVQAKIHATP